MDSETGDVEYFPRPEDFEDHPAETAAKPGCWQANRYVFAFVALLALFYGGGALYETWVDRAFLAPAMAAYQRRDYTVAEERFSSYLRWWGGSPDAHYYLGMCYHHDGRDADAIAQFDQDTYGTPSRTHEVRHLSARSRRMIDKLQNR